MTKPLTGRDVGAILGTFAIDMQLTDRLAFVAGVEGGLNAGTHRAFNHRAYNSPASRWEFELGQIIGEKLRTRPGYHME